MAGLEERVTALLERANAEGGFPMSLVCTDDGLLVAAAGEHSLGDDLAALASIFDGVVTRAVRDLGIPVVDELAMRAPGFGRLVLRPLTVRAEGRMFLVVQVPPSSNWRRTTNRLCTELLAELSGLGAAATEENDAE